MNTPSIPPGNRAGRGLLLVAVASIMLAACGTAASPGPTTTPAPSPGPSGSPVVPPSSPPIEHATGRTDVVFRFEEGGGFVPVGFFATEAPIFTLYGDGTVIFKDGNAAPPPEADGIIRTPPYRTIILTEIQIQAFLRAAISDGGLGVARDFYESPGADLPTATFTITAGGTTKVVSVLALGMDRGDGPDTQVLQALAGLGDRIRDFGREVDGEQVWAPDRWRGVLTPDAFGPPRAWPWPDVSPVDFIQHSEPEAPRFPVRTMSPDEIALLGLDDIEGGFSSLSLSGPDGGTYLFALRPLFPDEPY
ncbi:MAG TPA: hypothetical protein VLS28_12525 [Candidatus Sulfomarinibacteraceae bacterium]|nr:hypothetical protein [Candidatus Sulfomarinibacteraceae bacterium]